MSYQHILYAVEGNIARLTLNRPDRLNSFNDEMHAEVRDALSRVKASAEVRVLLLTGSGRGFCAGQDLGDRAVAPGSEPVDLGASIERNYKPLVLGLRALPLPVVRSRAAMAVSTSATVSVGSSAGASSFVGPSSAQPTPTLPWRGAPTRKPTTTGTSAGGTRRRSSARLLTLADLALVSATAADVATTSARGRLSNSSRTR